MNPENKSFCDLEYARVGERSLRLDLHLPLNEAAPYPTVVWLFG